MKKLFSLLLSVFMLQFTACADDKPITVEQLPAAAQEFIKTHFTGTAVSFAKMDTDLFDKSYEVLLANGNKLEFDKKGEWKEVECRTTELPAAIVPQQIRDYVAAHQPGTKIITIDRDKRDYEVKLNNGFELKFDLKFNLIDMDN